MPKAATDPRLSEYDTVFVAASSDGGPSDAVHIEPDCHRLSNARKVHEYSTDNMPLRRDLCEYCMGDVSHHADGGSGPWQALEAADPDDLVTDGDQYVSDDGGEE